MILSKGLLFSQKIKISRENLKIFTSKKIASDNNFQITFAKKGIFEQKGKKRVLVLYDGQTLNNNANNITNFNFSKSDFGLSNMDTHLIKHPKMQEQTTLALVNCLQSIFAIKKLDIINCNKDNPKQTYKELFKRLISPFYLPVLTLISLLLILTSKENLSYAKNKYMIFFIGLIIIILSESSLGYISNNLIKNISISILPLFFVLIAYLIFIYKLRLFNRKIL